jgi:hypothetical protein
VLTCAVVLVVCAGCGANVVRVREPDDALFCRQAGSGPGGRAYEDCLAERRITEPYEELKR